MLRPCSLIPTVNADTSADRERLLAPYVRFLDLSKDKRRLDWFFKHQHAHPPPKQNSPPAGRKQNCPPSAAGGSGCGARSEEEQWLSGLGAKYRHGAGTP
eukprot:scaffold16394_cov62-Isochrysis_galbana.AAC.1